MDDTNKHRGHRLLKYIIFSMMYDIIMLQFDHSNILKGGGGGIGSHGADGKGGGMEKGNPGIAPGAAEALSAFGWVGLLAPDSTQHHMMRIMGIAAFHSDAEQIRAADLLPVPVLQQCYAVERQELPVHLEQQEEARLGRDPKRETDPEETEASYLERLHRKESMVYSAQTAKHQQFRSAWSWCFYH